MTYEIKEYNGNLRIRITLDNGNQYDIETGEGADFIQIRSVDGSMSILPSVSNQIKITTN
jgi:hypothetical protein